MNSNDSGSHKNVPRPAPLNSPQTVRVFLSRAVVVANVVCASSPRPPTSLLEYAPPTPPPAPLDASWRSLLKALKSPLCTQISFQVCLPSFPPPTPTRSYFLRTDCRYLPWFVSSRSLLVLSPPDPRPNKRCSCFRTLCDQHVSFPFSVIYIKIIYQKDILKKKKASLS